MKGKAIITFILLAMLVICIFLSVETGVKEIELHPVQEYIKDNWINVVWIDTEVEYPEEWKCSQISNAYMSENPDWCVFSIFLRNETEGHAANYQIIDGQLFVHDETWECEYEFEDWRNMTLYLRECGEECEIGIHAVYVNVNEY